ncbi:MAG: hypothetical protein EOO28_27960 [Comamonadaceae bacterium]|nr:MAG: hypothetical protein EOO28_27960 [Comamonadaceae bacterium]
MNGSTAIGHKRLSRHAIAACICSLALFGASAFSPLHAAAAQKVEKAEKAEKAKVKKGAKAKATKYHTPNDWGESRSERTARLRRECFGAVNAGACEGYTR